MYDCILTPDDEETDSDNDTSNEDTTERNASPPKRKYEKENTYQVCLWGTGISTGMICLKNYHLCLNFQLWYVKRHDKSNLHSRIAETPT